MSHFKLPDHFFVSSQDGALYDTRVDKWHSKPPLRALYERHYREIKTCGELKACLRAGAFAWPGGYPMFFLCSDGEALSFEGARENLREIFSAIKLADRSGWRVVACDINYEDQDLYCAHTGKRIAPAYGDKAEGTVS